MANLRIVEEVDPIYKSNRFRIIEKINTIDGPRDRITDHSFPTIEAAQAAIDIDKKVDRG